jgi:SAM-dependent methyltransferase
MAPPSESIALVREAASSIGADDPSLAAWSASYARSHLARIAFDLAIVRQYGAKESAILEYGAVPLFLTQALHRAGHRVVGLDVRPERFATAIRALGLDVRKCDVERESVPFPDASFDVVVFNELLEHLRIDPIFTLREVCRVLAPGGTLLLSTPNLRSLRGIVNFLFRNQCHSCSGGIYSQYEKLATLGHAGHVREYTTREVREFLGRVGFTVEKMIFRGRNSGLAPGLVTRLAPGLRPYVTYVARKTPSVPAPG